MNRLSYSKVIIACAALLLAPAYAAAAEFRMADQPSVGRAEVVSDDMYMAGGVVTSSGEIRGDLIAGGGSVLVSGPVSGDVIAGGGNVTILGDIGDDIRVGGGNVVINGAIAGDAVVGGGQVHLSGPSVGGDVAVGGGTVRIDSPVSGFVKAGGGDVYINAAIGGDVEVDADSVTLGPDAEIAGNFTYTSGKEATIEEGAVVRGETAYTPRQSGAKVGAAALAGIVTLALLAKLLMSLAGAFVVLLVFRRYAHVVVEKAAANPLYEMGRGLVFLILTPIVSVILLVTVIGIPFGVLGLLGYAATLIFVSFVAPIVLGTMTHKLVGKRAEHELSWRTVLLGVVLYFILGLIPVVGWVVKFAIMLLALGAMMNVKWGVMKEWR